MSEDRSLQRARQIRLAGLGILAGLPYLILALVSAALSNSDLILADAIGTFLDLLSITVVWLVLRARKAGTSVQLDYGYGKIESLGVLLVAVITLLTILVIGGAALDRLIYHPELVSGPGISLGIGANILSGAANLAFFLAFRRMAAQNGSAITQAQKRLYLDKFLTCVVVVLAMTASLTLQDYAFAPAIDPVCTLVYLVWSCYFAWKILMSSLRDLLDLTCEEELQLVVLRALTRTFDAYDGLEAIRTRRSGDQVFVEIELAVRPETTIGRFDQLAREIAQHIHTERPEAAVTVVPRASAAHD